MISWDRDAARFQRQITQIKAFRAAHKGEVTTRQRTSGGEDQIAWSTLCNMVIQYYREWRMRALRE